MDLNHDIYNYWYDGEYKLTLVNGLGVIIFLALLSLWFAYFLQNRLDLTVIYQSVIFFIFIITLILIIKCFDIVNPQRVNYIILGCLSTQIELSILALVFCLWVVLSSITPLCILIVNYGRSLEESILYGLVLVIATTCILDMECVYTISDKAVYGFQGLLEDLLDRLGRQITRRVFKDKAPTFRRPTKDLGFGGGGPTRENPFTPKGGKKVH